MLESKRMSEDEKDGQQVDAFEVGLKALVVVDNQSSNPLLCIVELEL